MRKPALLILSTLFSILISTSAMAGDKLLTFAWEQQISQDFAGWHLYVKEGATGGGDLSQYNLFTDIPYEGTELQEYTSDVQFVSPDGESIEYFFVLTAFDTNGNESAASNEVSAEIDFESPGVPIQLKVHVTNN